jgi:hypothetical protein
MDLMLTSSIPEYEQFMRISDWSAMGWADAIRPYVGCAVNRVCGRERKAEVDYLPYINIRPTKILWGDYFA